ncbi:four helix bundle protein [Scytonema sp. UIC 10036]|uniref:four helix bundle protein n=1 Tax=Scytonema sp. UIC 10036 TaxID=2304196 RepID=UPI00325C2D6C
MRKPGGNGGLVAAFIAKLNDCEAEANEDRTWLDFAIKCGYINAEAGLELYARTQPSFIWFGKHD